MIGPLKIILLSFVSVTVLFLLTKLMGNKQISQMTMFDYIIGISIGSISAEMAIDLDENPINPLIAMGVYALLSFMFAIITSKSLYFRKIFTGRTILLFDNGQFYKQNFSKARMDISDFLMLMRVQGYFDMSQLQTVILEPNGTLSILPKSQFRPSTPSDMSLTPQAEKIQTNVIIDGHTLTENLNKTSQTEAWLTNQLKQQGIEDRSHIFLATVDYTGNLSVYKTSEKNKNPNPFD